MSQLAVEDGGETLRQEWGAITGRGRGQMDSPKVLTMQYMVLFSHRTVQLPAGGRGTGT